jgi:phospholipid transport system transporter-binding protein
MIRREGERMVVSGAATLGEAAALLEQGKDQIQSGVRIVDLGEVSELDSSALAVLLAWLREARDRNRELVFARLPEGLTAIARLYGVAELLPVAPLSGTSTHH